MRTKILILIVIISVLLIILIISFTSVKNAPNFPKYIKDDGSSAGVGYNYLSGPDSHPNSYIYIVAGLVKVYTRNQNVYGDFLIFPSSSEQTFLLLDSSNTQDKLFLTRQKTRDLSVPGTFTSDTITTATNAEAALKKFEGKSVILDVNFNNSEDFSGSFLKYLNCNSIFYQNFLAKKTTSECSPFVYSLSAYDP